MHVLVGEEAQTAQARLGFIVHYCFIADPRTERAIEPRAENASIIKVPLDAATHIVKRYGSDSKSQRHSMDYRADIRLPLQAFCDDLCTSRAFLQDGCLVMGLHRLGTRE
ncbi:hypothetical protein EDD15DRAFT_2269316 [Pisolithus albus]|nr:hypothetical protein EDD15DRAFT_2269316 [Pisolithus albus]